MTPFPLVDTHVHLWNLDALHLDWLKTEPILNRSYEIEQYREHTEGLSIEAMVCVEVNARPDEALLEARWLVAQAEREPRIQGIVAAAVEKYHSLAPYLDALVALGPRVKGVRRNLQDETTPGFCLQSEFVRGVQLLARYDLSFDLCLRHNQLADGIELVRRCPETRFILDHLAKPDIRNHVLDPWREQMYQLAALPNITCKMSGVVTEAESYTWRTEDLAPYVAHMLETFGEDRVMFGGDWPVLLLASSYSRWVETFAEMTAHLTSQTHKKLWSENAKRIYRLSSQ